MYDKAGLELRVETLINNPEEFRVRKHVLRDGKQRAEWVALRKGEAYLFRDREISLQANVRYLDALAAADDPTTGKQALQRLISTKKDAAVRPRWSTVRRTHSGGLMQQASPHRATPAHAGRNPWPGSA